MCISKRIAALFAAGALALLLVIGPALAQTSGQGSARSGSSALIATPGTGGVPLALDTSQPSLSGKAGQYVKLPSTVTNTSNGPVKDVVAYVSLVDVTRGQQAPVDLEDWSAHRAVTIPTLAAGQSKDVGWSLRLVKGGDYIVYANAIAGGSTRASVGQEIPLSVTAQKNLNPGGVLPVAIGVPIIAGAVLFGPVALRQQRLD
jgi:hypothetical protein